MQPKEREFFRGIKRMANPEGRFDSLRLDKNERILPLDRSFLGRYKKALNSNVISIYPEVEQTKKAVARYAGVGVQHVLLTHGSDAAIKQVFDVFARENSEIVLLKPTYAMYEVYAKMLGAKPKWIRCTDKFEVDENEIIRSITKNTSIVALANPNSPTGTQVSRAFLLRCLAKCQQLGVVLLVDEAYYHFSNVTVMPYVMREDNLVVTRTFSKAFGLAGCRAGFMGVSQNLVESINKARPMYEINALSALAVEICLKNSHELKRYIHETNEGKSYLIKEVRGLGLTPYPTQANFINIRFPEGLSSGKFEEFGHARGVLFKGKMSDACFQNCIRITLGPKKEMAQFLQLLKIFIKQEKNNGR